jgi:hypothetical protein
LDGLSLFSGGCFVHGRYFCGILLKITKKGIEALGHLEPLEEMMSVL